MYSYVLNLIKMFTHFANKNLVIHCCGTKWKLYIQIIFKYKARNEINWMIAVPKHTITECLNPNICTFFSDLDKNKFISLSLCKFKNILFKTNKPMKNAKKKKFQKI